MNTWTCVEKQRRQDSRGKRQCTIAARYTILIFCFVTRKLAIQTFLNSLPEISRHGNREMHTHERSLYQVQWDAGQCSSFVSRGVVYSFELLYLFYFDLV